MSADALIVDLFAGGGGASIGIEAAFNGEPVDIAINHDADAIAVHKANHPRTKHFTSDIWEIDPVEATGGRPVKFLHASPDCKHFSRAKGGTPKSRHIRALADVVIAWARKTRPLVITLENVAEFITWGPLGPDDKPIKALAGEFFELWRAELIACGYIVDHRVLDASEYGAPTKRRRFFLVARRDGVAITWPEPTHGSAAGLKPLRTAAECIDWGKPIASIFDRKKPLAKKTLKRIAAGIERYVLNNPRPFVVKVNHGAKGPDRRIASVDEPLSTIPAQRRGHAIVVPTLVQTGYGERPGQRPRYLDIHEPMGTLVGGGQKHALVATFIAKHFGDPGRTSGGGKVVGQPVTAPIGTITQRDHHSLVTASLKAPSDTAQPDRRAQAAFFIAYYGQGSGESGAAVDAPLPTVTVKPRFALVMVDGVAHEIIDIAMRMVEPDELARCQFGHYAAGYDDSAVKSKAGKTRLIGNSVPPDLERALAAVNLPDLSRLAA